MSDRDKLTIWAAGCPHVIADKKNGRESIADAIRQLEAETRWDLGINIGDYSAAFGLPTDEEGIEIVRQFGALKKHPREAIYSICGNHDRNAPDEPAGMWFRKYIDPMGENTATSHVDRSRYPYPVHGNWERYYFDVGNIRVLMMSDVNAEGQVRGRGDYGGNPGGVVTSSTFDWWVDQVERNHKDKIMITVHHYLLRETTVATGDWEGMKKGPGGEWQTDYHGYYPDSTPNAASYLYWVGPEFGNRRFENWLEQNPGTVDLWLGGHTHTHPDDTHGGKSHIERRYGRTTFMNVAALTRWFVKDHAMPHSRLLQFIDGSDSLTVQCYMHTSEYKPQGFYHEKEQTIQLTKPYLK